MSMLSPQSASGLPVIHIGTRNSPLALVQAKHIAKLLGDAHPDLDFQIRTVIVRGDIDKTSPFLLMADRAGNPDAVKSLWTDEMEAKLCAGELDILVHCLKDMPTTLPQGCTLGVVVPGEDAADAFVVKKGMPYTSLDQLPDGAVVGTSSSRRKALLGLKYPKLAVRECRGNIETRLRKLDAEDGPFSAIIIATAGLTRLGLQDRITNRLAPEQFPYAVGQGDLGIEVRANDSKVLNLLQILEEKRTRWQRLTERAMLRALQGGCSSPVGVVTTFEDISPDQLAPMLRLYGSVIHPQGLSIVSTTCSAPVASDDEAEALGSKVAQELVKKGAGALLDEIRTMGASRSAST